MKKKLFAVLAVALVLTMFCAQALAVSGDITIRDTKAYADAAMTVYVGTIPAGTALAVRSYDSYADVYVNGKVCYINVSALLNNDISSEYVATLKKGVKVYQRASDKASCSKLSKSGDVSICLVAGDWVLVRTLGEKGLYGFVKMASLSNIRVKQ